MTWAPIPPPPPRTTFGATDFDTSTRGPNGGPVWRKYSMFAELVNVGVAPQTIQPQGSTTVLPSVAGVVTLVGGATDLPGNTGAYSVLLRGLGAGFIGSTDPTVTWLEEVVELDGTNPVASTNQFLRLFQMIVVAAGSSHVNEGTITGTIGGDLQVQMEPGISITKTSHLSVPAGYNAYLAGFGVNWAASQPVRIDCVLLLGGVEIEVFSANYEQTHFTPVGVLQLPPMSDTWCRAARVGGGGVDPVDLSMVVLLQRIAV